MQHTEGKAPIVIAHRGASGYLPEHTLAAYALAIAQGADFIEPDLVMSKDRVLVARHENALAVLAADGAVQEATTNVAEHPEFADRRTTKLVDGVSITGWFSEDFSFRELQQLRARERIPHLRPGNTRADDSLGIPSFTEILDLIACANDFRQRQADRLGLPAPKPVGVYPETKHPSYFAALGLPLDQAVVDLLHQYGYRDRQAAVFIQSFEVANLKHLRSMTDLPLIQLIEAEGQPYDYRATARPESYADLITPSGLREIAHYADGIGVAKALVIPRDKSEKLLAPTALVTAAHAAGLQVHAWTFRAENFFLPLQYRRSSAGSDEPRGDLAGEIRAFLEAGIDGLFVDQPDLGVRARAAYANPPASLR